MDENWLKQGDEPLFPDVLWQKPERKAQAGKLLIIGGHAHGFDQVAKAMQNAQDAGVGEVKVALPDSLKPVVGNSMPNTVFTASEPSGGLAENCLPALLSFAQWADGVLLAQPGGSSASVLSLSRFCNRYDGPITLTNDLVPALWAELLVLSQRPKTQWVLSFEFMQKLLSKILPEIGLRHDMGLRPLVLALQQASEQLDQVLVTELDQHILVAYEGTAVSTARVKQLDMSALAAWTAVWWLQQPSYILESITTAVFEF